MKNLLIGVLIGAIIILGAWLLFYNKAQAPAEEILSGNENPPIATSTSIKPPVVTPAQSGEGLIKVTSPTSNQIISSPINVSGEAKGTWYFEASAPVEIRDANGKLLGQGHIEAQGDWMTTNFVPFKGAITFTKSTTSNGTIIFMNDNPSGLPTNQKTYSIPVKFVQ